MDKKFIPALLQLTDIVMDMDLVGLKHGVTFYHWIVKEFDTDRLGEIDKICEENNLRWEVTPAPYKNTNGATTKFKFKLNRLGYKRKPLTKGELPKELIRAKLKVKENL